MGAEPSPAGTKHLRPRPSPGDGVGQGSGPGLGRWAGGLAGRRGGTPPGGCPGRIPTTPRSATGPRGSPRQRRLRVSPLPPTLREGTAGGRDVGDARTWAGASCRSAASSRRRSRGLMVPAGAARRGRPHRPSPVARGASAARAPWRGPGRGGRGPGAGGGSSAAPSRALSAGSAAQRSSGGRRSRAGGRPVAAGGGGGDGGGGGGPGPGWRAGGSCDPDTRSPPGRGAGAGRGRGGEAAAGARPLHTPPARRSRGKGTHRPGGRAPGSPPPGPGGRGAVSRRGPGGGRWAESKEPGTSSEKHFIARVLGSGKSRGVPRREHRAAPMSRSWAGACERSRDPWVSRWWLLLPPLQILLEPRSVGPAGESTWAVRT